MYIDITTLKDDIAKKKYLFLLLWSIMVAHIHILYSLDKEPKWVRQNRKLILANDFKV